MRMRAVRMVPLLLLMALTAACGPSKAPRAPGTAFAAQLSDSPPSDTRAEAFGAAPDAPTLRLMFVGASVTEGWFASARNRAYPALVTRSLQASGRRVRVRLLAHPGATAADADHWDLAIASDVVVVQIATNDWVTGVPLATFDTEYADMLRRLRLTSATADLICFGAWEDPSSVNKIGVAALSYDQAVRSACDAEDGRYIDLSGVYMDPLDHGPEGRVTFHGPGDVFHPNDRGHQELASLILADGDLP